MAAQIGVGGNSSGDDHIFAFGVFFFENGEGPFYNFRRPNRTWGNFSADRFGGNDFAFVFIFSASLFAKTENGFVFARSRNWHIDLGKCALSRYGTPQ